MRTSDFKLGRKQERWKVSHYVAMEAQDAGRFPLEQPEWLTRKEVTVLSCHIYTEERADRELIIGTDSSSGVNP